MSVTDRELAHQPWWAEAMPAAPLLLFGIAGTAAAVEDAAPGDRLPDAGAYALVAVAALALLLRRRRPLAGLAVCGTAIALYLLLGYPFGPVLLTAPAAAYAVGAALPWLTTTRWVAGFLAVTGLASVPRWFGVAGESGTPDALVGAGLWAARWTVLVAAGAAIGTAVAARQRSESGVRREKAARAASEERLAMARDVHDGVGHTLAVVAMHAGVALHVLDRDPDRARELLRTIQSTSRQALDDLRTDLARLRSAELAGTPRRPGPGLADLPVLLDRMREGGLRLTSDLSGLSGEGCPLPAEVDAAAYRIVQESLTNVLRHAGAIAAGLSVIRSPAGDLVVEVTDDGPGATAGGRSPVAGALPGEAGGRPGEGTGITGMRQRAEALGGTLEAGPRPRGGFAVRAVLPIRRTVPA